MIIFGAILTVLGILIFVFSYKSRKKRENKKLQSITDIANQNNCKISLFELCGDFIIGLDETNRFVFFSKKMKDDEISRYINLAEVKNCKISNAVRTVGNNGSSTTVIDRLSLQFVPKSKDKSDIELEFFNADENTQLSGELQVVEKWNKIVNDTISGKRQ
jgi:hypothetical protein